MKWLIQASAVAVAIGAAVVIAFLVSKQINGVAYRGPGDLVPGATAFYGLRAYDADYAQAGTNDAIKLHRASDNSVRNIAVLQSGMLDINTALSFCAGTLCSVAEWYDQTGHGNNIVQNVPALQPVFNFEGYGTSPAVQFDGAEMTYLTGSFPWVSGNDAWSGQAVLLAVAPANWFEPLFNYGTVVTNMRNQCLSAEVHDAIRYQFITEVCGNEVLSGLPAAAPMALTFFSDGSYYGGFADGVSWAFPFTNSNIVGTVFNLGGSPAQEDVWFTGSLGEVILYARALSAPKALRLANDERKFFGF